MAAAPSNPASNCESEWGTDVNPNSDAFAAADGGNGGGGSNAATKPAWNKKSNGSSETGSIMGAELWPALAESARASPKSSSSESLKANGSVSAAQAIGSAVSAQATMTIHSPTLSPNHSSRQKHMKRGGANANGGFPQAAPPQLEIPSNNVGKPGGLIPGESSSYRDNNSSHSHKETQSIQRTNVTGSQSPSSNDHQHQQQQQRSSFRRNNSFPHPRGEGSYHQNYRGNQEWNNAQRNFGRRDPHMQSPRSFHRGGFMQQRAQHTAAPPFIPPQQMPVPLRPYGNHMGFAEVPSPMIYVQGLTPDSLRGVPFVAPLSPHPMFIPGLDPLLPSKIVNQIDYYFSNENLVKDTFLRRNMDEQGWIPITLIASFKKVSSLTDNIQLILDSLRSSTLVEVQGERLRRRNDWMRWIMPSSQASSSSSSPHTGARSSPDMLAMQVQNIALG